MTEDPTPYAPRALDARYDQPRRFCVCGGGYFTMLTPGQVHDAPELGPGIVLHLRAYVATPADRAAIERLPMVECVQCRSRYDRSWRAVG